MEIKIIWFTFLIVLCIFVLLFYRSKRVVSAEDPENIQEYLDTKRRILEK